MRTTGRDIIRCRIRTAGSSTISGNNRGLVHSYVDSNNVINGQTYYYAVVAYDHGDSVGIPPTESTKKITVDPITSELTFDVNTAQVVPGPRTSGTSRRPSPHAISAIQAASGPAR